jgi:hypothetical protein
VVRDLGKFVERFIVVVVDMQSAPAPRRMPRRACGDIATCKVNRDSKVAVI